MQHKFRGALVALATATIVTMPVLAEPTAEDALDYRKAVMTALRGHIGASSMIVRGLIDNDGHLVAHAEGLANGAKELHRVFPAGSNVGDSEALPAIWEQPAEFRAAIAKAEDATAAFVDAAKGGDSEAIGAAFRNVGMACRGCHDHYRAED